MHIVHQFGDRKFSGNVLFCELDNALPIPANPIPQCLCDSVVNELRFLGLIYRLLDEDIGVEYLLPGMATSGEACSALHGGVFERRSWQ